MDATALGMNIDDFHAERFAAHALAWLMLGFLALWIAFACGIDNASIDVRLTLGFIGAAVVSIFYGLSCIVLLPLLPLLPLAWLSIRLEARWRVRRRLPYVPYPASPVAPRAAAARRRGRWLLPLAIGLWIGGAWGGDD